MNLEGRVIARSWILGNERFVQLHRRGVDDMPVRHMGTEEAGKVTWKSLGVVESALTHSKHDGLQLDAKPGIESAACNRF